mgnify:CR=1 FL=1
MYKAIKEKFNSIKQKDIAKRVGITEETLSRIINGKQATQKTTAYCIVKAIDSNAEIEEYFVRNGE